MLPSQFLGYLPCHWALKPPTLLRLGSPGPSPSPSGLGVHSGQILVWVGLGTGPCLCPWGSHPESPFPMGSSQEESDAEA